MMVTLPLEFLALYSQRNTAYSLLPAQGYVIDEEAPTQSLKSLFEDNSLRKPAATPAANSGAEESTSALPAKPSFLVSLVLSCLVCRRKLLCPRDQLSTLR